MAKEFINPNWHVLLIHYPLGIFVLGMVIELLSFMYRRSTLRTAGRWMILLGALSAVPTALSGVYAFANVARMDLPAEVSNPNQPWHVIAENSHLNNEQWEHLRQHTLSQAIATGVCAVLVTLALGCSDNWRRKLYFPILLGLLFGLVAMVYGSWHGGEMVYRHGTAVLRVQHKGATPEASAPATTESAADEQSEIKHKAEFYAPPIQVHVLLAGMAVAFALGALGLSMRAIATAGLIPLGDDPEADEAARIEFGLDAASADPMLEPSLRRTTDADVVRSLNPVTGVESVVGRPRRLPVSRLWVLAFLLGAGAALAGVWMLGGGDEVRTWEPRRLWDMVAPSQRRLWHVISGGVIVVVPLLLAAITRVSRRPKVLLGLLSLVLLAAVALQVWLGVLLMFDTPSGPVSRFNRSGDGTNSTTLPTTVPTTAPATLPAEPVAAGQ